MARSFVTPEMLATFRQMTESAMPDVATLRVPGAFVDEGGGSGYRPPGTDLIFGCRVTAMTTKEDVREFYVAGQLDVSDVLLMTYPTEITALTAESILTIASARHGHSFKYEVVGLPPVPTYAVHRQALIRRMN